jgi:anti-sigma factor RsiW
VLSCNEILERHSEYMDGEMSAADAACWRAHLAACAACARYDRVLRNGLRLLAAQPTIQPDPDFTTYIRFRIADENRRATRSFGATSGAMSVAAVLALAALLPVLMLARSKPHDITAPINLSSNADLRATEIAWHGAMDSEATHENMVRPEATLAATNPGASVIDQGYTPLILESPTAPPSYSRATFTSFETR